MDDTAADRDELDPRRAGKDRGSADGAETDHERVPEIDVIDGELVPRGTTVGHPQAPPAMWATGSAEAV